jgi:hypothetical protein
MERRAAPISTSRQVQALLDPIANGRMDQKIHSIALLTDYVLVLRNQIAQTQAKLSAPGATPAPNPAGDNVGAGGLPPPASAAPANVPLDPKQAKESIQNMQALASTFTSTIRTGLRDNSAIVRYWAETSLAQLSDPQSRKTAAAAMVQGQDWEERVLGLMLANDLPNADGKAIAQTLTADRVSYVKDFANATLDVANLPPSTRPATAP